MLYFGEWRATVRNLSNTVDAKVSAENSALARKSRITKEISLLIPPKSRITKEISLVIPRNRKIQRWRGKYTAASILYYPRPGDIFRNRNDFNLFGFRFLASSQAAYIYIAWLKGYWQLGDAW